jgi:hypothetical protein
MQTRSQTRKLLEEANANANANAKPKPLEETIALALNRRVLPDTILYNNLPKKKGQQYKITIDFDEASKAWRANKIPIGDGQFKYRGNLRFPCNETC